MSDATDRRRIFLFLQGPHGPFFSALARMLRKTGADVWRVGFNAGDRFFWDDRASYLPYTGTALEWEAHLDRLLSEKRVSDLVLYGDTRPIHAQAVAAAKARGITVHVFEEGYLRPYWVTYERGGSNGNSRLMKLSVADMQRALTLSDIETHLPPSHWGDMRQHVFYGVLYHALLMVPNRTYAHYRPHRALSVRREFRLHLRRLLLMPVSALERIVSTARIRRGGFPYHLALLQLEHDSAFQSHSPFSTMTEFVDLVLGAFARGAPGHHHLVFKAHPLDDGRVELRGRLMQRARALGLHDRVHFVRGGKLARLLDEARTAVTVNSTAGQQVLWRGIPLKIFGAAVYGKPEFVSDQPLGDFFAGAPRKDNRSYKEYRRFLLETSQLPGGYYSAGGRRQLLRQVVDMMLSPHDPYEALLHGTAAPRQQLRMVR